MLERFEQLYDEYKNDIFRLSYSYTKNKYDAEDITQNVFLKLYKNNDVWDTDYLKKWLIKTCVNECKTYFLSSWKNRIKELTTNEDKTSYMIDKKFEVLDEIFKLNKKERLIIHLYYYEGYKTSEIAQLLKTTNSAVKMKLSRIRDKLKKEMGSDFEFEK